MKPAYFFIFFLVLSACVEDGFEDTSLESTVNVDVDSERADRSSEIRLRAHDLTVWMRPAVEDFDTSTAGWSFQGRTSRNIRSISGFIGIAAVEVEQLSARKFRVNLPVDALEPALIGDVFVTVETSAGTHTIRVELGATFERGEGSSYIYPYRQIELVGDDGIPTFRGIVSTRLSFDWLEGWNDDDSEPTSTRLSSRRFQLDFAPGSLTWSAHPFDDGLFLTGEASNGRRYQREANIAIVVRELGLTDGNPRLVWPAAECDSQGTARERIACGSN